MICWNEEKTIDLSLKSIADFADEVVIVDTGSFDNTLKVAQDTMDKLSLSGQIKQKKITKLVDARLESLQLCNGDWVLMQDSNLVLSNALKHEIIKNMKNRPKFGGAVKSLNLMGDYSHFFENRAFMDYHRIFVKRDEIKWLTNVDRPVFLGKIISYNFWAVNLSRVRPAWRYWLRGEPFDRRYYDNRAKKSDIQNKWLRSVKYPSLIKYVKSKTSLTRKDVKHIVPGWLRDVIRKFEKPEGYQNIANIQYHWQKEDKYHSILEYIENTKGLTIEDVKELAPEWFLGQLVVEAKRLTPAYKLGLPEVIREEMEDPRYKLIYEDDEIVGRWPEL